MPDYPPKRVSLYKVLEWRAVFTHPLIDNRIYCTRCCTKVLYKGARREGALQRCSTKMLYANVLTDLDIRDDDTNSTGGGMFVTLAHVVTKSLLSAKR